jgi:hypothetical protein
MLEEGGTAENRSNCKCFRILSRIWKENVRTSQKLDVIHRNVCVCVCVYIYI